MNGMEELLAINWGGTLALALEYCLVRRALALALVHAGDIIN